MTPRNAQPAPHRRTAFSLVEILITVAIISILITVVAIGGSKMKAAAKAKRTRVLLSNAAAIATEYEVRTKGKKVNHADSYPVDWLTAKTRNVTGSSGSAIIPDNIPNYSIERFIWAAWQPEETRKMAITLGASALVDQDGNGFYEVRDDWGNKIIYVASSDNGFVRDTITPIFISAGPDGAFGDVRTTATQALQDEAKDNIYSDDRE